METTFCFCSNHMMDICSFLTCLSLLLYWIVVFLVCETLLTSSIFPIAVSIMSFKLLVIRCLLDFSHGAVPAVYIMILSTFLVFLMLVTEIFTILLSLVVSWRWLNGPFSMFRFQMALSCSQSEQMKTNTEEKMVCWTWSLMFFSL